MRPAGDVRQALMLAAAALATPDQAPTLAELAAHAKVGYDTCRATVANMRRHGALAIVRERRVAYRNRPVAEYAPVGQAAVACMPSAGAELAAVLRCWA